MDNKNKFKLNNNSLIPEVGLGVFRIPVADEAYETVKTAISVGYRHIDTAMIYENEEAVGKAIKDSGIPREELFITTKLWNDDQKSGKVEEAIDLSLKKLGLDYVDLYLVHWPMKDTYVEVWKKMEEIYTKGKTRSIGVSNYEITHLEALLKEAKVVPAVNQIECYPYFSQDQLVEYCHEKGIIPEAWGPLGAGKTDIMNDSVIVELSKKYDCTPAQIILQWNIARKVIVIPKSVHKERMIENLKSVNISIEISDIKKISKLNKDMRLGPDPNVFGFE